MTAPHRFALSLVVGLLALATTAYGRAQQPSASTTLSVPRNVAPHPAPAQPLPFSHKTHVSRGLQCRTCHVNPDPGALMTFPAMETCMGCHRHVAADRPTIMKLAEMARANQPIPWVRVYSVLAGVTWSHRPHLKAGVQCVQCHGNVAELESMAKTTAVTAMASCVGCHQARKASTACATCHRWP